MAGTKTAPEDIVSRGKEIYERSIKSIVEHDPNIGRVIVIDPDSGDYEVDDEVITAVHRLRLKHPGVIAYIGRVGFPAFGTMGGPLERSE